jgi:hypothetical protein
MNMNLRKIGHQDVYWIEMAQDKGSLVVFVNMVINLHLS